MTSANGGRGVNLIGFIRSETGVGQSCRLAANALETAGIPFCILPYDYGDPSPNAETGWMHKESAVPLYQVNLFHVNADQMPDVIRHFGLQLFAGRYNIGYWHWELPEFPDRWRGSFDLLQEIWAPSQFIAGAVAAKSPVPVVRIPHGIAMSPPGLSGADASQTGGHGWRRLTEDRFTFLSMYSAYSFQERKNPYGAIDAFRMAFRRDYNKVALVVKINHAADHPGEVERLQAYVRNDPNIRLLKETMTLAEAHALLRQADCVVSLHRSEGFGFVLAEAMAEGIPVIATHWSGNTDFMNERNSCPVQYKLVPVGTRLGPYEAHQTWAEPSTEHAAHYMERLFYDDAYRMEIGRSARQTIRDAFSPEASGEAMKERLQSLGLL